MLSEFGAPPDIDADSLAFCDRLFDYAENSEKQEGKRCLSMLGTKILVWDREITEEQKTCLMNTVVGLLEDEVHIVLKPYENKSIQFEPWNKLKLDTLSLNSVEAIPASHFTHVRIYEVKEIESNIGYRQYLPPNKWHEIEPNNESFLYLLKNCICDNTTAGGNIVVAVKTQSDQ